ncbi:MAG TPA: hypothetical protein VM328_08735 [Fimbriimonadaceae bacterium]|nr:hypothetical protein [Fimbriimonadaceae bacterium]
MLATLSLTAALLTVYEEPPQGYVPANNGEHMTFEITTSGFSVPWDQSSFQHKGWIHDTDQYVSTTPPTTFVSVASRQNVYQHVLQSGELVDPGYGGSNPSVSYPSVGKNAYTWTIKPHAGPFSPNGWKICHDKFTPVDTAGSPLVDTNGNTMTVVVTLVPPPVE